MKSSTSRHIVCPIEGCNFRYNAGGRGWTRHVASATLHPFWHPTVSHPDSRVELFRKQFAPSWLGPAAERAVKRVKNATVAPEAIYEGPVTPAASLSPPPPHLVLPSHTEVEVLAARKDRAIKELLETLQKVMAA